MGNIIKINCRELYKDGMYIASQVDKLKEVVEEMRSINEDIKDSWDGSDYHAFYNKFNEYLDSFSSIEAVLTEQSDNMKKVAKRHGNVDNSLLDTSKRWGSNHVD
jgi:uncharacterized protein YukE